MLFKKRLQKKYKQQRILLDVLLKENGRETRQTIEAATHAWKHLEAWHGSRRPPHQQRTASRCPRRRSTGERRRVKPMTQPMDPPDVEMEMEPAPQPPAPTAVGEGWSMLSRARGLLEEGKPSLALQAVRTLPPLPFSVRSPFPALSISRLSPPSPGVRR